MLIQAAANEWRVQASECTVDTGVIGGAPYYIEIPANWNKGLVLYTHGYTPRGDRPPEHQSASLKASRRATGCGVACA